MADTLSERLTGPSATAPVSVALNLVMADTSLFGDDDCPRWCQDYGPISATALRLLVRQATAAHTDTARAAAEAATVALRRLYRHPRSGQLVAMESKARLFPKGLARFISLRDQTCRTPFCHAPISPLEHRLGIDIVDLTTWRLKHTPTHRPPEPAPDGPESDAAERNGSAADGAEPDGTETPPEPPEPDAPEPDAA